MRKKGVGCILLAAVLWGTVPIWIRNLYAAGADPLTVAASRCYISAIIYLGMGIFSRSIPRLQLRETAFYLAMGFCGVVGPFTFYALANQRLSSAMSSILLYTAPAFVILFSRLFYKQPITKTKLTALALIVAGCFLVVRGYDISSLQVNALGIVFGLMAGLCYASLTLLTRKGLEFYPAKTNTMMSHLFAAAIFMAIRPVWTLFPMSGEMGLRFLAVGVIGSTLPYLLYMTGMGFGVEGGDASLISSVEPIVAAVLGVLVFADPLEIPQMMGMALTLAGVSLPVLLMRKDMQRLKGEEACLLEPEKRADEQSQSLTG